MIYWQIVAEETLKVHNVYYRKELSELQVTLLQEKKGRDSTGAAFLNRCEIYSQAISDPDKGVSCPDDMKGDIVNIRSASVMISSRRFLSILFNQRFGIPSIP
jgi:hypothetical protein